MTEKPTEERDGPGQQELTAEEAERRAVKLARRLLNTPWKPHLTKKQEVEQTKTLAKKTEPKISV